MPLHRLVACGLLSALAPASAGALASAGCGDDDGAGPDTALTLYQRLGEEPGIARVVDDFVGQVLADAKINGYFLNSTVDGARLTGCLVKQIGNAAGGPQVYPDPAAGCRDMTSAHAGLGISAADFGDLVGHLVDALTAADIAPDDIESVTAVLAPLATDIVEDPGNDATVYQRVGRKPAILAVVNAFFAINAADARINGFFTGLTSHDRVRTCLTRMVCSIDGPCQYGYEVDDLEPGVDSTLLVCRDMFRTHSGLYNNDDNSWIGIEDFNALVENLVMALDGAGVATDDKNAILGVLGPMCTDIVHDPETCPR